MALLSGGKAAKNSRLSGSLLIVPLVHAKAPPRTAPFRSALTTTVATTTTIATTILATVGAFDWRV